MIEPVEERKNTGSEPPIDGSENKIKVVKVTASLGTKPKRAFPMEMVMDYAIKTGVSDLIIKPGTKMAAFVEGKLHRKMKRPLDEQDTMAAIYSVADERALNLINEHGAADFAVERRGPNGSGRFRISAFRMHGGYAMVMRLLPNVNLTLQDIGVPPKLVELIERPKGLILVTGPTGSGKTTSLAAMNNHLLALPDRHIITIEDPVEYRLEDNNSIVTQREVGQDTPSFKRGLIDALRQAPDVIMIGEMRDQETVHTAITAAETGHLVMSTLHTNSAHKTINRVTGVFPEGMQDQIKMQLSEALSGVLCQSLVPRADGKGRIAVFEFLNVSDTIRNLIREGKTFQIPSYMQNGMTKDGHLPQSEHLRQLVQAGVIRAEDALAVANNLRETESKISRL